MCSLKSFLAKIFLGNFLLFNSLKILLIFLFTLHLLNALLIDLQPDQPLNPVDAVEIRPVNCLFRTCKHLCEPPAFCLHLIVCWQIREHRH